MIGSVFLALQSPVASEVAPEEFRRKVGLHHMCLTDHATASGYKEVGLLYLARGENVADVALSKPANQPPMFEKGLVTQVKSEKEDGLTRIVATLNGQRSARAAQMVITLSLRHGDGMGVSVNLLQGGEHLQLRCFPDIRGQTK